MNLTELYRRDYGRMLASLIRVARDFTLAEDALQEAFVAAHVQWPDRGTPADPTAWLYSTARHKVIDEIRRRALAEKKYRDMVALNTPDESVPAPQDRLRLIFTCCHPALALDAQVALTLHTIGGLTTEEIARAFVIPVPTLAQRLVRAKTKIRVAGIPYEVPADEMLASRLEAVLVVLYLLFNEGYSATAGRNLIRGELRDEAIRLARDLVELLPAERESRALLALMLLTDARRETRVDAEGELLLLEEQDRTRWNRAKIAEGTALLEQVLRAGPAGPYAVQAAISAVHAEAPSVAQTDWRQIVLLYARLAELQPSPIIELNRAVAIAFAEGPAAALAAVDAIDLPDYHLLPAVRADLLRRLGRRDEAAAAYRAALALVRTAPERRFLERRLQECSSGSDC